MVRRALGLVLAASPLFATLVACGDDTSAGGAAAGGSAAAGGEGGAAGGAPSLPIDPRVFDCSRPSDPERVTKIPIACATDRACTEKLVSGHRGASHLAPEDTVSGVFAAVALGADFVETDPRPTSDGHLVNLHDPTVDRTTDGTGDASDLTLAEIQALHVDTTGLTGDFACEHVPTLQEILTAARGRIHVLIDANKTDRVDLLVGAIQETDTVEWAIFDTSSVDKIDEALALEPGLHTMIRIDDATQLEDQLAHFAEHPPVIVEIGQSPDTLVPAVHAEGHRALLDLFGTDIAVGLAGDDVSLYGPIFDTGLDIGQTDRADLVLRYLGRFPL